MTLQQAYDHARAHLLAQNAKSLNYRGYPVLLDTDGRRSALGCFIPPERLTAGEFGGTVRAIIRRSQWKKFFAVPGLRKEKKVKFFKQLMDIHDFYDPNSWRYELDGLAEDFGLKTEESQ